MGTGEGGGSARAVVVASRYNEDFVKWIPVVVPLLALLLAIGTYFIFGMID